MKKILSMLVIAILVSAFPTQSLLAEDPKGYAALNLTPEDIDKIEQAGIGLGTFLNDAIDKLDLLRRALMQYEGTIHASVVRDLGETNFEAIKRTMEENYKMPINPTMSFGFREVFYLDGLKDADHTVQPVGLNVIGQSLLDDLKSVVQELGPLLQKILQAQEEQSQINAQNASKTAGQTDDQIAAQSGIDPHVQEVVTKFIGRYEHINDFLKTLFEVYDPPDPTTGVRKWRSTLESDTVFYQLRMSKLTDLLEKSGTRELSEQDLTDNTGEFTSYVDPPAPTGDTTTTTSQ